MTARGPLLTALSVLAYLGFCLIVAVSTLSRPVANWDMLAYTGAVLRHQGETRPAAIHARSYEIVRQAVSPDQMQELSASDQYRRVQARDADAFVSMLPMYEVKGGYVALVAALSRFADPVTVMRGLSLAATLGLLAILPLALWRVGALAFAGLLPPALMALRVGDLASISTPDPLVAFLAVAAGCLILTRGTPCPPAGALLLLLLAVWIRPDMLVATTGLPFALVAGAAGAALLAGSGVGAALWSSFRAVGFAPWLAAVAGVAVYLVAKAGVAHPGWWAHFNFTFVAQQESMAGFAPAFDIKVYLTALARVTARMLRDELWPWLVLAVALWGVTAVRWRELGPALLGLLVFVIGVFAARTVAFPLPDSRVAAPTVLILLLVMAAHMGRAGGGSQEAAR
jgi:hypothetical protein